jgi:murein DD-endopeptidase MepM/ murein hydrolase activator NlpD
MLDTPEFESLPFDEGSVLWISPFGEITEPGTPTRYHNGIDIGLTNLGNFFSCAEGIVTQVELDTGDGWHGTNYRIMIKVSSKVELEYHFEIGGDISEEERKNNIFVSKGERVRTGQHIANLINLNEDIAHVHFSVSEGHDKDMCPVDFFSEAAAKKIEELYDKYARISDHSLHPDICK